MCRRLAVLLLLVGLVSATLHAAPTPTYAPIDAQTDLARSYVGARYYASQTGRFTTVDPAMEIEAALVDPQRWNRYAYARNNPLTYVDPDGRNPILLARLLELAQRAANSPAAQRAATWAQMQGMAVWNWATRFFNSPAGQETVQTVGELVTGAQAPAGLLPALSASTKAAFLEAAVAEGRGGVSAAGRALQSHASRAGSWLADLAQGGNAAANTAAARKELLAILESGKVAT